MSRSFCSQNKISKSKREGRNIKRSTMMGVSENSSISVNVVAWFDFTSLHSITDQTHLFASPAPFAFWVYFFIQPPLSSIGTNLNCLTTVTADWNDDRLKLWLFLLEKKEKGKTKRKKPNGWVVVWQSMVGWSENQLNKPIHLNFSFWVSFSSGFALKMYHHDPKEMMIKFLRWPISLYVFLLFLRPHFPQQINTYRT